jgi:hypothetical protein
MCCRVSPANCGVSPDTVCSSELVPAYVVPTAEPSSLCMAKAAFLAALWLVEKKVRFTGQSSQIFHDIAPTWHTHTLPQFWTPADHVFRVHPEQNQVSPVFVRSSAYRGLSWNVASTKFFPIFRLCHAVDPVTQETCNMYGTTQLLYDSDGAREIKVADSYYLARTRRIAHGWTRHKMPGFIH